MLNDALKNYLTDEYLLLMQLAMLVNQQNQEYDIQ